MSTRNHVRLSEHRVKLNHVELVQSLNRQTESRSISQSR